MNHSHGRRRLTAASRSPLARTSAAVAAVAVVALLAGCGTAPGEAKEATSPLGAYLAPIWGSELSEDAQQARFAEQNKEFEELVAACMTEAGFEYTPSDNSGTISFGSADEWKPDDADWVAEYGYGMVKSPSSERPIDPDEGFVDPNGEYVESLSESEREAYYEALSGPIIEAVEDEAVVSEEWDWEKAGCYGRASHEQSTDDITQSEEFAPIMEAISTFYSSMESSPELAEIDGEWAACMASAGHPDFSKRNDAQTSFNEKLNEYYESQTEFIEDDPALKKLGAEEIELAVADLDCRTKTDYMTNATAITHRLEEQFITDHKAELDALIAAAERAR